MSRAANTLLTSDVLTTPIKLKYSSSYDSSSYYGAGIKVSSGVNGAITISGSVPQKTINYVSVRHLFYSNYLTGSVQVSASAAFNWEQSTAALGTLDADVRNLPTGSGDKIKILGIPRGVFGQKISRNGFQIVSNDGTTYYIVDDGNGNLVDLASDQLYVNSGFFNPGELFLTGYVVGQSRLTKVGNIIYSQGLIIITNPDYYNILDAGPEIYDRVFTFYDTDNPKVFNPLSNAQPDSSPIDTASLTLIPIQGQQFPSYTINTGSVLLTPSDPLYTTLGSYYIDYSVTSSIGTPSNIANINVNIVPDCTYTPAVDDYYGYGTPELLFDFTDRLIYRNSGSVVRDMGTYGNNGTMSYGSGSGTPTNITTYTTNPPSYLILPGTTTPATGLSVALPAIFKSPGTAAFSLVTWINLQTLGLGATTPGIVSAEGVSGGFSTGWAWYFNNTTGITAIRHNGAGGGDTVTLPWSSLGSPSGPYYNQWLCLSITYDGADLVVGGFKLNGTYQSVTVASATSITSTAGYSCFMGQRNGVFPQAYYGYLAGYQTVLTPIEIATIFAATKHKYGY